MLVVPRVFLWFPGDFGGRGGVRRFLVRHGIEAAHVRLRYAAWDWTPAPGAWRPPSIAGSPTPAPTPPTGHDSGPDRPGGPAVTDQPP